jgi:hypothetical protein
MDLLKEAKNRDRIQYSDVSVGKMNSLFEVRSSAKQVACY